jgi:hypothetical protein
MMFFFVFLIIIFKISISKRFKNIKKIIFSKFFLKNFRECGFNRVPKRSVFESLVAVAFQSVFTRKCIKIIF